MHISYMTYMVMLAHKNPYPRGHLWNDKCHEIQNFGRPYLAHHYCKLSLSDLCPEILKNILK